jgi:amino acid adenylation domain-containing protein
MSQDLAVYRLSPQQKNLWKMGRGIGPYYAACELLIKGNLDSRVMRSIAERAAASHEILRTRYRREEGLTTALQVVDERLVLAWKEENLTAFSEDEQEERIAAIYDEAVERKRNGEGGLSINLIKVGRDRHVMQIALCALSADSRTLRNLIEEIGNSYSANWSDNEVSDEPVQYAQFSEWQAELLEDRDAEEGKRYWREHPGFARPALEAPLEALDVIENPSEFHTYNLTLGPASLKRIDVMAEKYKTTADIVLLACWQTLLWRHTGHPEITVGNIVDGRKFGELQTALGLLSSCLPVHLSFNRDLRFEDLLKPLHQAARDAFNWQEYYDWEEVATARGNDDSAAGFLPYCFEYEQAPILTGLNGLDFAFRKRYSCISRFKIKLNCLRADGGLAAQFYYDPRLFSAIQIKRLAAQYTSLLANAVNNPGATALDLEMLGDSERRELLEEFNQTATSYPADLCVHELFERQAVLTPDKAAVSFNDEWLSYQELNARANQAAHYLRKLGVGPDAVVGISIRRSVEMVVGLLGILKAGGAYLPMEPTYPAERLRYMLEDAGVSVVLTEQGLTEILPAGIATQVCVDRDSGVIGRESRMNPNVKIEGKNLAYVIYTSGSTGKPKGVMVEHQGLANYVNWSAQAYELEEGLGAPVHSPLGFDLTVTSLYPPLVTGKTVWLAPEQIGIEGLVESLKKTKDYSLLKITPAHLEAMRLLTGGQDLGGASRAFVIGGEALRDESLEYWRKNAPGMRLINEYGPTETVVGCCTFDATSRDEVSREMRRKRAATPIGKPIANMQMYVADERMRAVASGVVGELYIGGAGVARGYLNRPDLTAERFLPNPWVEEPGARVYGTGDLGMHLGDEGIEFLGRVDDQVKIRGYRIELAEIETVLEEYKGVKQSKVVAYQQGDGEKQLIAYVVCGEESGTTSGALSVHLKTVLPEYMAPAKFLILDSLPLTANGKVDIRALPAPQDADAERKNDYVAPRSAVEEALAEMWAAVLKREKIGVHDDFFVLGGHSLLVIQLIARLREDFQVELEPIALFEASTVAKLAEMLTAREPKPGQTEKIALVLRKLSQMTEEGASAELAARARSAAREN